jgi:hypothetical protein
MKGAKAQALEEFGIRDSDWMLEIDPWDYQAIAKGPELKGNVQDVPDTGARPGESTLEWALRMLVKHLQALAAEADTLLRAYPPNAAALDELVNDYDHYLNLSMRAVAEGFLCREYFDPAMGVNEKIDKMSGRRKAHLWTEDGLRQSLEWAALRQSAVEALRTMGFDLELPPPLSM